MGNIFTTPSGRYLMIQNVSVYKHFLPHLKAQEAIQGDGTIGCPQKMRPLLEAAGFQEDSFTNEPVYLTSHGQQYFIDLLETVRHVVAEHGGSFERMKKEVNEMGKNIFYVNYLVVAKVCNG